MAMGERSGGLGPEGDQVVRAAVTRFAVWSVVAMVALGVGTLFVGRKVAEDTALQEARMQGEHIAETLAAPLVNRAVRIGRAGPRGRLDRAMRARMAGGGLTHVKLWAADGTVIWSDERSVVGRRYQLDSDVRRLFGTHQATADLSHLDKPENAGERASGELLEVYAGASDADGVPMVFEAYLSTERMRQHEWAIIADILAVSLGGLVLFQVAVLPLALSLARRVEHREAERSKMVRHVLLATELERRRIAQDLHDGVIQDLAGLSYAMPVVAAQLPAGPEAAAAREAVSRVSDILASDVAALRSMLTDIYPHDLAGPGFVSAVHDLAQQAREKGVEVEVRIPAGGDEPLSSNRLAYRVIREGLRNVVRHARATSALVELHRTSERVDVRVADNGVGVGTPTPEGHLGLRLLEDTVRDFGGSLELTAAAGGGALLEASFPVHLEGG